MMKIIPAVIPESQFEEHNHEVEFVWKSYHNKKPVRIPIIFGTNTRFFILNPDCNTDGITFQQYSENPDIMFETQLEFQYWSRHHILQDAELGLPTECWTVYVDFQNYYEAAWFGAKIKYLENQVPDTIPFLNKENKWSVIDTGIPDPFKDGIMEKLKKFHDYFIQKSENYLFHNLPVKVNPPSGACGSDGPLTIATNLRGTEFYLDFYEDPDYVHQLLNFITESIICRIKTWRKYLNLPDKSTGFSLADDAIQSISTGQYKEFVLRYHRRIFDELSEPGPRGMHLCGDVMRHLPIITEELNMQSFDTGFPIDFKWVRNHLGPDIEILGGPTIMTLIQETPDVVETETRKILQSGICEGGRFILREANNLAPGTPLDNMIAMYETGKKYGKYS